jgi:tetratricopeptide (TPR) repeat protein
VNRRLGRWEEAVAGFRRTLELDPRSPDYLLDMAGSLHPLRRYPEAKAYYERAEQLAPENIISALEKGWLYFHWRGITDSLHAAIERTATMADPLGTRQLAALDLSLLERDYAEGLRVVETAPDLLGDQTRTYPKPLMRGWLLRLMGDPRAEAELDRGRATLERAVREQPEDYALHLGLGRAYALLGRRSDAAREARRAMELLPLSRDAYGGLYIAWEAAGILAQSGEGEEAVRIVERLLEGPGWHTGHDLRRHPDWDPVRNDPRFNALLRSR